MAGRTNAAGYDFGPRDRARVVMFSDVTIRATWPRPGLSWPPPGPSMSALRPRFARLHHVRHVSELTLRLVRGLRGVSTRSSLSGGDRPYRSSAVVDNNNRASIVEHGVIPGHECFAGPPGAGWAGRDDVGVNEGDG